MHKYVALVYMISYFQAHSQDKQKTLHGGVASLSSQLLHHVANPN